MERFKFTKTDIEGLTLISPFYAPDGRGYLSKTFEKGSFAENGIDLSPYEELRSLSKKGVIRGLHFQHKHMQDKLVSVVRGSVYDIALDIRKNSPTFGQWRGFLLTAENREMLYIPKGFAHGFLSLEDDTLFSYLCGDRYDPDSEDGILWCDPELKIDLRETFGDGIEFLTSEKDSRNQTLARFKEKYGGL